MGLDPAAAIELETHTKMENPNAIFVATAKFRLIGMGTTLDRSEIRGNEISSRRQLITSVIPRKSPSRRQTYASVGTSFAPSIEGGSRAQPTWVTV